MNGLLTSILLETFILSRQMILKEAFKVAIGMSFISMIAMELAMNIIDVILTGGAKLTWWVIPIMLFAGFITPLPYNYYRLKKWGFGCAPGHCCAGESTPPRQTPVPASAPCRRRRRRAHRPPCDSGR